jgi:uncharacterized membrane-anchored protein
MTHSDHVTIDEAAKVLRSALGKYEADLLDALTSTGGQGLTRTVMTLLQKAVIAEAQSIMRRKD